jgi:ABC-2 type transport system ATP-binding protein
VPVIRTRNLIKHYRAVEALKGVSLEVARGEIFGLLGQNGAGKTTLVKILLGITRPTAGKVELLGQPAGSAGVRKRVGYLPEDHHFPDYHTGASLLDFYGALLEVPASVRRKRIPEVLETVGLKGRMHSKIRTYSKGMKQRLGIAQAILHEPEVLFLDEPTDGVDPLGRREIRELLQTLKAQGKTIFINSHLLSEVELVCDRVAILQQGQVIREGDIATLTRQKGTFVIGLAPDQKFPWEEVAEQGYTVTPMGVYWEVDLQDGQTIDPVIGLLHTRGLNLRHLVEKRQTLEDLFLETVESVEPGVDAKRRRRPEGDRPVRMARRARDGTERRVVRDEDR